MLSEKVIFCVKNSHCKITAVRKAVQYSNIVKTLLRLSPKDGIFAILLLKWGEKAIYMLNVELRAEVVACDAVGA